MAELVEPRTRTLTTAVGEPAHAAFRILHVGFIVAPTLAGLDKFFHLLVDWDQYLAPAIARLLPFSAHRFMLIVGVVEVAAGLLVAIKPRIGGLVVAAWLAGIVLNLLIGATYWDIALRDFGLMLGALALSLLATRHERSERVVTRSPGAP
jgi:hypothetical protein